MTKPISQLTYYSAPQANIYINGVLLDECYDIQYSYRETKEPIYGYLSKFFDAMVDGTVIITGSFTINYKHDQYLAKVLQKANDPTGYTLGASVIDSSTAKRQSLTKYNDEYKSLLSLYATALTKKKAALNGEKNSPTPPTVEQAFDISNPLQFIGKKEPDLNNPSTAKEPSVEDILDKLRNLKSKINNLTATNLDLQSTADDPSSWNRAEDIKSNNENGFVIEFNFNGTPHKKLVDCTLLGHAHQISLSGQPVKEYYQFVARAFDYQLDWTK
jgi:hypothetical protein